MKFFRFALVLAMLVAPGAAFAQDTATWERDVQLIERGVIQDLDDDFLRTRKREDWDVYADQFRVGLERFEGVISPQSYAIMAEIHRQLESDFTEFRGDERWQEASYYIRNKFGLVSFTMNTIDR